MNVVKAAHAASKDDRARRQVFSSSSREKATGALVVPATAKNSDILLEALAFCSCMLHNVARYESLVSVPEGGRK
jgi:hypothetical protein